MKEQGSFLIIGASAGSGKTFRLVMEYLLCCLRATEPDYFKQVLAITFTRNAAMEMRDRILSGIDEVVEGEGDLFRQIQEASGLDPQLLQQRAVQIRRKMLHQYEDFSVMTIDSFVSRLVRSFARELALEEDFRVELSLDDLVEGAVSRLLDKVGHPDHRDITEMLEAFTRRLLQEEKDIRLRKQLTDFGKLLGDERALADLAQLDRRDPAGNRVFTPQLFIGLHKMFRQERKKREAEMRKRARTALEAIAAAGLTAGDFHHKDLPKWLERATGPKFDFYKPFSPRLTGQIEAQTFIGKNAPATTVATIDGILPDLLAATDHYQEHYLGPKSAIHRTHERLEDKVFYIGALVELRAEFQAYEAEENVRLLQSLNVHIAEIVQNNPTPFIYERLGVRYKHLFIDEFQDTSITQWHNLVPLVADLLAEGNRCLVVGDAKQAIYRWRNGDYEQLNSLPQLIGDQLSPTLREHEAKLISEANPQPLGTNHRSAQHIVAWNNTLYREIQSDLRPDLAAVYAGGEQFAFTEQPGTVTLTSAILEKASEFEEVSVAWVLERLVHQIGGQIETHEAEDGTVRYTHHPDGGLPRLRPPSDCAILVRTNKQGAALAKALLAANIKTFTDDSLQLGRHPVPLGVIALLRSILEPDHFGHGIAFVQCYCALTGANEAELLEQHRIRETYTRSSGEEGARERLDLPRLLATVCPELKLEQWTSEPLVGLIGHIVGALGWDVGHQAYVEGLLEQAQQAKTAQESGIPGFLDAWDRRGHKESIRSAEQPEAVRIKTIHKAKGQAFPVVLMPVAPASRKGGSSHLPVALDEEVFGLPVALLTANDLKGTVREDVRLNEMHKDLLDEMNVLYVGMTRPKVQLDMLVCIKPLAKPREVPEGEPKTYTEVLVDAVERAFGWPLLEGGTWTYEPAAGAVELHADYAPRAPRKGADRPEPVVRRLDRLVLGVPVKPLVVEPPREWWTGGGLSARQRGDALHSLLGQIRSTADLPAIRNQLQRSLAWSAEDRAWLEGTLDRMLANAGIAPLFVPGLEVELERSFWLPDGHLGRPDRLVLTPEGWVVLDFKTGKPSPKHHDQVRAYMEAVGPPARGLLYYTPTDQIVEVTS